MRYNHGSIIVLSVLIGVIVILSTDCSTPPTGGSGAGGNTDGSGNGGAGNGGNTGPQSISATVVLYTGEAIGGGIGQAIKDPILADTAAVATVSSLDANKNYIYTLGDQSGTIAADAGGKLVITKAQVKSTNAADGARLTLNKEGNEAATQKVLAVYHPRQIYTWQDLQAMRVDMAGHYMVMNDIEFPALGAEGFPAAGFAPIGNDASKFTGSVDGNGKTLRGLAIQGTHHVGVFGAIEGAAKETEVVKNLTLHNASVAGNDYVGVLAGIVYRGTVSNVAVTVDEAERERRKVTGRTPVGVLVGSVEAGGVVHGQSHINIEGGFVVGGLVGDNEGTVTGYATGTVFGDYAGGLVGYNYDRGTGYGYVRGLVRRKTASFTAGAVLGAGSLGAGGAAYYSTRRGSYAVVNANGSPYSSAAIGTGLTVDTSTTQAAFGSFTFGTEVGQWTWVGDGNWPEINLGPNVGKGAAASEQPTAPSTAATQ